MVDAPAFALRWDAQGLQQQLGPLLPGLAVEVVASCPSTNTALLERARAGEATPMLLVAEAQTAGRGRQGRHWASAPGASLTCSLGLPYAPQDWQGLSLAVGVALADALDPAGAAGAPRLKIKWPNDLWLAADDGEPGRKLAGILIETVSAGAQRVAVIGIGINVLDTAAASFGARLDTGAAAWRAIEPAASAPLALARVMPPLLGTLRRFEREGLAPFAAAFTRRDLLRGRAVSTTQPGAAEGIAEGIDARGALLVRAGGTLHAIVGGEVSVRPLVTLAAAPRTGG